MKLNHSRLYVAAFSLLALCAGVPAHARGPAPAAQATSFHATGFSPAWHATLHGQQLAFMVPTLDTEAETPDVRLKAVRTTRGRTTTASARHHGKSVVLQLQRATCDKATEGQPRAYKASLTYGGKRYLGCADAA